MPLFGTLLAVERDGELQAAVLSAPALRERWWARRGGGAWARGGPDDGARAGSGVSRVAALERRPGPLRLAAATSRRRAARRASTRSSTPRWRERGFGDFWGYALLAEGAAEAMVEVGPLVRGTPPRRRSSIEEAGGRVTDFDGRRAIDAGTFVATNGLLHDEVLGRLRGPR